MRKNKPTIYHLSAWLAYYLYKLAGNYFFAPTEEVDWYITAMLLLSYTLSHVCTFYYCYSFILPTLASKKRVVVYSLAALLTPFIFVLCRYSLEELFYPALLDFRNYGIETSLKYYLLDNVYRGLPSIAIGAAVWGLHRAHKHELEKKQLKEDKVLAEQAFLKSQVNPHFLYNTLNFLYSIAYPLSDKLGNAIIQLSKLMRYMTRENPDGKVDVLEEIEYINSYIEIYKCRFEHRLFVTLSTDLSGNPKRIAPLLLIPFVENVFKHGVINDADNPVQIAIKVDDTMLSATVYNKAGVTRREPGGVGQENVRRRLELLYPDKHKLHISEKDGYYKVEFAINFT